MTSIVLRNAGRVFCRKPFHWGVSDIFVMLKLWWWLLGRKATKGKMPFLSHHVKVHPINMTNLRWCCPWSPGQESVCQTSPLQIQCSSHAHTVLVEENHHMQPAHGSGELVLPPWEGVAIQIIQNSVQEICLFSPFYLILYLFQYGPVGVYYRLWALMSDCYFVTQIFLVSEWLQLALRHTAVVFFQYFHTLWYWKILQAHLSISCPSPGIDHSSEEPWSLLSESGI